MHKSAEEKEEEKTYIIWIKIKPKKEEIIYADYSTALHTHTHTLNSANSPLDHLFSNLIINERYYSTQHSTRRPFLYAICLNMIIV